MEKQSITDKPIGHKEWLKNLVIREKDEGRLCICLDPKYWNIAIINGTPSNKYFGTPKLCGLTVFSTSMCKVKKLEGRFDATSSLMTTLYTSLGMWELLRMPFGLKMSHTFVRHIRTAGVMWDS